MDEPCSALDPISTIAIEALMRELKQSYTIVIVTHNMQQATRVSDFTGFFNLDGTGPATARTTSAVTPPSPCECHCSAGFCDTADL